MVSLIPNLSSSVVRKDYDDIRNKVTQTLEMLLFLAIPMVFGLSFLAEPIWTVFYGQEASLLYGSTAYQYYVFVALAMTLFTSTLTIVQVLKDYKVVFISLLVGFLTKVFLNVPLLYAFPKMGLPSYYGSITATLLGYLIPSFIALIFLHHKYKVNYEQSIKRFITIFEGTILMLVPLYLLRLVVPLTNSSRFISIGIVLLYAGLGASIYFLFMKYTKVMEKIFGTTLKRKKKG